MKKRVISLSAILVALLFIVFFDQILSFIVNIQWYSEVGYLSVYFIKLVATLKLMVPLFILSYICIWIYYRSLRGNLLRWKKVIEIDTKKRKVEKKIFIVLNAILSFAIAYVFSSNYWYRILQFSNSTDFHVKDPIFNKDVSFFIFRLPLIQSLYSTAMMLLVFFITVTLVTYFVMSATDRIYSMDIRTPFSKVKVLRSELTKFAGKQLAVVSSLIMLFLSLGYLIKSWDLVYSSRGVAFGASYTDVHVTLLFYKFIIVTSLIASIVILLSVLARKVKPIIFSVVLILVLIVGEGVISGAVQNFIVKSNEKTLEEPYIRYNIEYTRKAFNIENLEEKPFQAVNDLTKQDISENQDTIENIKINSFKPALEFYNQTQVIRYYYGFNDIDIDRYNVNGKYNQVFIAPREINLQSLEDRASTWQNKHLVYTHGYGVVMSKVNTVTPEGQPDFVIKDIPPVNGTDIPLDNPRIYFGEKTNEYAIVDTKIKEFDYPKGGDNQTNSYEGKAGIKMSFLNRLLFAVNQRNLNFLLSRDITKDSKILINRNIMDRVNKVAPFLIYDKDPYSVIDNGKLYWIIDAYTASDKYPFSELYEGVNYIRNSVKVIVDAVDGTMDFYIIDKNDPIANSYAKIFPKLFKDEAEIPESIRVHFRYPEDLFSLQSSVLGKYHVTDPGVFYNGEDLWEIAENQKEVEGNKETNEASYVVMKVPGYDTEEMVLLEYFNMRNKDNMVAMVGARMDGDNYGKMFSLKFPPQKTVYSPYLFKQKLNQDTTISQELSLWNKEGSSVYFGDTIIVPVKNSLLYVEPLYLRAQGKNSIPEVKRVVVSYADKVVLAQSINEALDKLFNISAAPQAPDTQPGTVQVPVEGDVKEKIKGAKEMFDKAVEAQKNGDWATYGEYLKELQGLLNDLVK